MVVVIQRKNRYASVLVTEIGVEKTVVSLGPNDDDYIVEGYIDLGELQEGDTVRVCEYIAVSIDEYTRVLRPLACLDYRGPLENPVVRFHTKTLLAHMLYRVTVTQLAGSPRSLPYSFIEEIMAEA